MATQARMFKAFSDTCLNQLSPFPCTNGQGVAFKSIRRAFSDHRLLSGHNEDDGASLDDLQRISLSNQGLYSVMDYPPGFDGDAEQPLIATNVDDEDDLLEAEEGEELVGFCCNCGCGVGLNERGEVILEEDEDVGSEFSEDEGCYLITNPPSLTPDEDEPDGVEVPLRRVQDTQGSHDVVRRQEGIEERETERENPVDHHQFYKGSHENEGNTAQNIIIHSSEERRSFSSSVDSGRSSHSGTLTLLRSNERNTKKFQLGGGEEETSSSSSLSHDYVPPSENVQIVSHSHCDFLAPPKIRARETPRGENLISSGDKLHSSSPFVQLLPSDTTTTTTTWEKRSPEPHHHQEIPVAQEGRSSNKVSVFVPYSALKRTGDYLVGEGNGRGASSSQASHTSKHVRDVTVLSDNVVICDTQVILRINCSPVVEDDSMNDSDCSTNGHEKLAAPNEIGIESQGASTPPQAQKSRRHLRRPRATRRMTTTVAVYEMLSNSAQLPGQEDDSANDMVMNEEVQPRSGEDGQDLTGSTAHGRNQEESTSSSLASVQAHDHYHLHGSAPNTQAGGDGGGVSAPQQSQTPPPPPSSSSRSLPPPQPRRRKKDLCKLLGLIECDVTTDATRPEDIQRAQKVALDNLISAIREAEHQKRPNAVRHSSGGTSTTSPPASLVAEGVCDNRKKDLAKFLGIEEVPKQASQSVHRSDSSVRGASSNANERRGLTVGPVVGGKKKILSHLLTLWKEAENHTKSHPPPPDALSSLPPASRVVADASPATSDSKSLSLSSGSSIESDSVKGGGVAQLSGQSGDVTDHGAVQQTQMHSGHEASSQLRIKRTNRKNLNKYLGLDDSDSEEMVFIQNRKTNSGVPAGPDGETHNSTPCGTGSSFSHPFGDLNDGMGCSGTGSSIVGIRIDCAEEINPEEDGEVIKAQSSDDEDEFLYYDDSSISGFNSTLDSLVEKHHRSRSSFNNFLHRRSTTPSGGSSRCKVKHGQFRFSPSEGVPGHKNCSSLGSGGSKDEDDRSSSSPQAPARGKTVIFKDYNNFSVEESLAQGLPVPYHHHHQNILVNRRLKRKKKKDADRRSAEVRQRQRNPPEVLLHTNSNQDWIFEDHKKLPSRRMKNIMNGGESGDHALLDILRAQQHQQHQQHHFQAEPQPNFSFGPGLVSCNPKGRVKVVRSRLRPPYRPQSVVHPEYVNLHEMHKVLIPHS